jgi:hypothetical protein
MRDRRNRRVRWHTMRCSLLHKTVFCSDCAQKLKFQCCLAHCGGLLILVCQVGTSRAEGLM